jgi:hypothetical protein
MIGTAIMYVKEVETGVIPSVSDLDPSYESYESVS